MGLSHQDREKGGTKALYPTSPHIRRDLLLNCSNSCIYLGLLLHQDSGQMGNWVFGCLKCPLKDIILQSKSWKIRQKLAWLQLTGKRCAQAILQRPCAFLSSLLLLFLLGQLNPPLSPAQTLGHDSRISLSTTLSRLLFAWPWCDPALGENK